MRSIELKSTGSLIDELITTTFKVELSPTSENINRFKELDVCVRERLHGREDDIFLQVIKLRVVLKECWNSQEVVRNNEDIKLPNKEDNVYLLNKWLEVAKAGIKALTTNRERNKLIREIDEILGETNGPLNKTY